MPFKFPSELAADPCPRRLRCRIGRWKRCRHLVEKSILRRNISGDSERGAPRSVQFQRFISVCLSKAILHLVAILILLKSVFVKAGSVGTVPHDFNITSEKNSTTLNWLQPLQGPMTAEWRHRRHWRWPRRRRERGEGRRPRPVCRIAVDADSGNEANETIVFQLLPGPTRRMKFTRRRSAIMRWYQQLQRKATEPRCDRTRWLQTAL